MTEHLCVRCGRPTPDGYACTTCAQELADALTVAAGHADDAQALIARQVRYEPGGRGGSSDRLGYDAKASTRLAAVTNAVGSTMRVVVEESGAEPPGPWRPAVGALCPPWRPGAEERRGNRCGHASCAAIRDRTPPSALAEACTWLAGRTGWLRQYPAAGELFRELHDACAELARLVDRPADKELVGMCDCGRVLYAPHGKVAVTCPVPTCKLHWNVAESRDILRRALGDKLVTLPEAARLAAYLDSERTQDTIRKLISARVGQLVAHGEILVEPDQAALEADPDAKPTPRPTYRFGEIISLLAAIPRRKRQGVAA